MNKPINAPTLVAGAAEPPGDGSVRSRRVDAWLSTSLTGALDVEKLLYITLFVIAIASRTWDLGARVMSHDESLHTFYSFNLAQGKGFQHTPLMHGPFLFHITALSYFLFGADDFTARLPIAVFGAVLVVLPYLFRNDLGRVGALVTATAILISPSLLYHARYIRQEGTIVVWTVLSVLSMWRYMETRKFGWLVGLAAVLALHGTDKSTSFFSVAVLVAFAAPLVLLQFVAYRSPKGSVLRAIGFAGVIGAAMLTLSVAFEFISNKVLVPALDPRPAIQAAGNINLNIDGATVVYGALLIALGIGAGAGLFWLLRRLFGEWIADAEQRAPAFDVVVVLVTTTMFMASSAMLLVLNPVWKVLNGGQELISIKLLGDMGNFAANMNVITTMFALNVALASVSAAVGLLWNWKRWLVIIGVYFAITVPLFTTVFTNATGIGTGFVGQLGYWMAQQDIKRGNQPWYYYYLLTPLYEYLVLMGALCAMALLGTRAVRRLTGRGEPLATPAVEPVDSGRADADATATTQEPTETRIAIGPLEFVFRSRPARRPRAARELPPLDWAGLIEPGKALPYFLVWWAVATVAIYTIAGEKMPWLVSHIALPMSFLTGYFVNWLVTGADWRRPGARNLWAVIGLAVVAVVMLIRSLSLLGSFNNDSPQASEWVTLGASLAVSIGLFIAASAAMRRLRTGVAVRTMALAFFGIVALLTMRTAVTVTYINYDYAKEFLFYAHGAPGVKIALGQLEDLSKRITGGTALKIGYESDVSWPMSWYMRNFPSARFLGSDLPTDFESLDVVLIGDYNQKREEMYQKLQTNYTRFDYTQVWWPMQDYWDLTWERIRYSLVNPKARAALWEIVFNRNYKPYAELFNKAALTENNWQPSHGFTMWVRNDIASRVWDLRVGALASGAPASQAPAPAPATLQSPSSFAFGPGGERYALDRKAHRVFRFDAGGASIGSFGGFGSQPGQFNDPWGIRVDSDGNVLVADTFNHRIQKFDREGNFLWSVGAPGVTTNPGAGRTTQFFGPRDLVIGRDGIIFVSDTGNKRVQVLDRDGNFITQFGGPGAGDGQFDEPVGLGLDSQGNVYVADVWNQRVQVFSVEYRFVRAWKVDAWSSMPQNELRAVDHKPFIALNGDTLFITSPRTRQVLAYRTNGQAVDISEAVSFEAGSLPTGVAVRDGKLYVSNAAGGALSEFQLTGMR